MNRQSELLRRLDLLERRVARLRRFAGLALLCAVAVPLFAAFSPTRDRSAFDEVKARRFVVLDDRGGERGALEFTDDGASRLVLRDPSGAERILVTVDPGAAMVIFRDEDGKNRLGLACDRFPHLMLQDEHQMPRIHASIGITGAPSLVFRDSGGDMSLGLGIDGADQAWRKPGLEPASSDDAAAAGGRTDRTVPPPEPVEVKKKGD